jgi:hypothetical protein
MKTIKVSFMVLAAVAALGCSDAAPLAEDWTSEGGEGDGVAQSAGTIAAPAPREDPVVLEMERTPERFFSRSISIRDRTGRGHMRLRVVSNDRDALDVVASSDITLRVGDDVQRTAFEDAGLTGARDLDDDGDESEDRVKILIFEDERSLPAGDRRYAVTIKPRGELKLPWKNFYHYTFDDCAEVTRLKALRRVYVSMWSKATKNASWSTKLSNYKLAWKETVTKCHYGSYQLKTKVRTKVSNAYSFGTDSPNG